MTLDEKYKKLIFYSTSVLIVLTVIFIVYRNINAPTGSKTNSENAEAVKTEKIGEKELKGVEILNDPRFRSLVDTKILREYLNYITKPGNKKPFDDGVEAKKPVAKEVVEPEVEQSNN